MIFLLLSIDSHPHTQFDNLKEVILKSYGQCRRFTVIGLLMILYVPQRSLFSQSPSRHSTESKTAILPDVPEPMVLYDFNEGQGDVAFDAVKRFEGLELGIADSNAVRWISGGLEIQKPTLLTTALSVTDLSRAIERTGEVSIEAWVEVDDLKQDGPARLITLSGNPSNRNFTLGQDGNRLDFRLRTSRRDRNGLPSTTAPAGSLEQGLNHVVVTRRASGQVVIYQNGISTTEGNAPGDFNNWNTTFQMGLANEIGGGRPWLGKLFRVAIYDRALDHDHIDLLFQGGSEGVNALTLEQQQVAQEKKFFMTAVAPLLSKHCLECHDTAIQQGGLDLSSRIGWDSGGDSGDLFNEDDVKASLVWERVESDEMPHQRPPLSSKEKQFFHDWLTKGARWSLDKIDPATYQNESGQEEVWVQRLTVAEYIATVRATFEVDIAKEAYALLPEDVRADGFSNTAYNMSIDLKHIEAYQRLAEMIVNKLDVLKFASRFGNSQKLSTDDTMRDHITAMGRWVLRGEITEAEQNDYSGVATTVASVGGDFELAIRCVLEAMLQSPRFIYRIEYQRGRGMPRQVSPRELANRMSYILWGASPDEELVNAAERGNLRNSEILDRQIDRMLSDPRAVLRSKQFIEDWLDLDRLAILRPEPSRFPTWNPELASQMREETLQFFVEVVWKQGRPLSHLMNAQVSVLRPELAKFYGLVPQNQVSSATYDLSQTAERGGLLTQASVLTVGGDDASMVSRGLFVLHDLLRGVVNSPPPCVNTTPPPTSKGLSQRAIAESRIADETCGVCHSRFEPLAFGLETFNGIGAFHRIDEHGNPLREDGEVLFPGDREAVKYESISDLMNLLAESERVKESLTWKVVQFALGRPLTAEDAEHVLSIHVEAQQDGGSYRSVARALIRSELVQKTRTEETQ